MDKKNSTDALGVSNRVQNKFSNQLKSILIKFNFSLKILHQYEKRNSIK